MRQVLVSVRRPLARSLATVGVVIAASAGCGERDRPSVSEWSDRWNDAQALVPTEQELLEAGGAYCDQLLEQLRAELPDLVPAAIDSIDPVLAAWIDHLRHLAFECPSDPSVIRRELTTLHEFESEIDAGLTSGRP